MGVFRRGGGPLVSVLLPSRGRPKQLVESILSLHNAATDKNNLEFLCKLDNDDPDSLDVLRALPITAKLIVSPRGNGYADMHLWINQLAKQASGDWLLLWNDDTRMLTKGWDNILEDSNLDNGVSDVCCLSPITRDQPGARGFPFVRKQVTDILGRYSPIPHNDTWITTLLDSVNSSFWIPQIEITHCPIEDEVRQNGDSARSTTIYTTDNPKGDKLKKEDANKLRQYIHANKNVHTTIQKIREYFPTTDADTALFLDLFNEPAGCKILEIGAHDEPVAIILANSGHKVIGVDLREPDPSFPPPSNVITATHGNQSSFIGEGNFEYIRGDFCNLPREFWSVHRGTFDVVISLSALEHFGMGTYQEGPTNCFYDVLASRYIWDALKEGGRCYLTVPFGKDYMENWPHWRVYNWNAIHARLIQDFSLIGDIRACVAEGVTMNGNRVAVGGLSNVNDILNNSGNPSVSALVKMQKITKQRIAPDGR